jgi:hypothetical protein
MLCGVHCAAASSALALGSGISVRYMQNGAIESEQNTQLS